MKHRESRNNGKNSGRANVGRNERGAGGAKNGRARVERRNGSGRTPERNSDRRAAAAEPGRMPENLVVGRNPVMEVLKSGRGVDKLLMLKGAEGSALKIEGMARGRGIEIQYVQRSALDRIAAGAAHQGVAAYVSDFEYCEPEDILKIAEDRGEDPFIIVLDGIEDPHNLGAILRTADAAGAQGVIIPKRRAAAVTPVAEKAAAGAAEYVPVARVANVARTLDELKERGVWTVAADMGGAGVWETDLTGPVALVIGNEGSGISRLVMEKCDFTVAFPMRGRINSLNASNAAALLMYEIVRQRLKKAGRA